MYAGTDRPKKGVHTASGCVPSVAANYIYIQRINTEIQTQSTKGAKEQTTALVQYKTAAATPPAHHPHPLGAEAGMNLFSTLPKRPGPVLLYTCREGEQTREGQHSRMYTACRAQ